MSAALALADIARPDVHAIQQPARRLLRFITCGSVDDGKSTLIGRILHDAGAVPQDQLDALDVDSRRFGTQGPRTDLALLVDGLAAEREQGITIDVAYRYFATPNRSFIVADTPGHEQYTRNMATGASGAELAIILIDARKGVLPQTRRHAFIVSLVGVRRVVLAVNKMDLAGFDEDVFRRIETDFRAAAAGLGFDEIRAVPVSALEGDNVALRSPHMSWYDGPTLLGHLETVDTAAPDGNASRPFRLPVQWVNRPDDTFRGFSGTIAGGAVAPGDAVVVLPAGTRTTVAEILGPSGRQDRAGAGEAVTLRLADEVDASRGDVIVADTDTIVPARAFRGRLLWMAERTTDAANLLVRVHHVTAPVALTVHDQVDIETYERCSATVLPLNGIGRVTVRADRPLVAAPYARDHDLGAFILIDRLTDETVALGVIDSVDADTRVRPARQQGAGLRLVAQRLLAPEPVDAADRLSQAVAWRIGSAFLLALVVAFLTGSPAAGLAAGSLDAVGRTVLRAGLGTAWAGLRRRRSDVQADGSGI
jgi:bifunctional enzyme CysN/CysC